MKKNLAKLMVIILALGTIVSFSACSAKNDNTNTTTTQESTSAVTSTTTVEKQTNLTSSTTEKEEKTTATTTKKATTEANSSVTVNQALDLLQDRYGKDYEVNGTISEGNYYYFAVVKDGNKYASVKVNLSNAKAEETLTSTGKTTSFSL